MNPPVKFYWLVHHGILLEPIFEPIEKRITCIKECKPPHETPTRLEWMREVLHPKRLPRAVIDAGEKLIEAEYGKGKTWKAGALNDYMEILYLFLPEVEALHREECPGCPFDYEKHTLIFPKPQPSP